MITNRVDNSSSKVFLDTLRRNKLFYLILFLLWIPVIKAQDITKDTLLIKEVEIVTQRSHKAIITSRIDTNIIQKSLSSDLSDLLSENSSVFVKSLGRGALSTVSFRGTAPSHTDVLWNGISLQSPMLGEIDFSQIPVFLIDDINIEYGGASLQHSTGALGGNILLDNKVDWTNKHRYQLLQSVGSFATFQTFAKIDLGNKKWQSKTRLFHTYSRNNFEFKNKNIADIDTITGAYIYPIQKNKNAQYQQYGLLQELYYRWGEHYNVSLIYWGQNNDRYLPRMNTYEGDDYANIAHQDEATHRIVAKIRHLTNRTDFYMQSAFFTRDMIYYLKNYISGRGYQDAIYSQSTTYSWYQKLNYTYRFTKHTKIQAQYQNTYHHVQTEDTLKKEGYQKERLEHVFSIHWQQDITKRLSSVSILKQYFIDSKNTALMPYWGLDYTLSKTYALNLKTSLSYNKHFPSLNDWYWQPGGNPNLLPERSWNADLSLQTTLPIPKVKIQCMATVFYADINDWILWIPSPLGYWSPQNVHHVISKGVEIQIKERFTIGKTQWFINSNYAYTLSTNMTQDTQWGTDAYKKQLPYIPKHSFNIFVQMKWKQWQIAFQHHSYSERYTTSTNDFSRRDWLYPYFMNQLILGKNFKIKTVSLAFRLKVLNFLNEEYRSVLGRAMPGRHYLLSMKITY